MLCLPWCRVRPTFAFAPPWPSSVSSLAAWWAEVLVRGKGWGASSVSPSPSSNGVTPLHPRGIVGWDRGGRGRRLSRARLEILTTNLRKKNNIGISGGTSASSTFFSITRLHLPGIGRLKNEFNFWHHFLARYLMPFHKIWSVFREARPGHKLNFLFPFL